MNNIKHTCTSIIKSDFDSRQYRGLMLSNDMRVLLIRDKHTEMAEAAVAVCVGHMNNPPDLAGLAHLCEHLIGANSSSSGVDLLTFISQHGGTSNASTSLDTTLYHFEIPPEHLGKGVQKLSESLKNPKFSQADISAEVTAINNEHEGNMLKDEMRFNNLLKLTANPNHPYRKFDTGNRLTLEVIPKGRKIDVSKALQKFHETWYSSNIMSLCILGKQRLDVLQDMAVSSFGDLKNSNVVLSRWLEHPYGLPQLGLKCYIAPVMPLRYLEIRFPIPDFRMYYKADPGMYLVHVFETRRPGSLKHFLYEQHLCYSLDAMAVTTARGFGFFVLHTDLTDEGLQKIDIIVKIIFQYIHLLKNEEPKKRIHDQLGELKQTQFKYGGTDPKLAEVTNLAVKLHLYPLAEVISGSYLMSEWRPDLIKDMLSYLDTENLRLFLVSQEFESKFDRKDPWFGTRYALEEIPLSTLRYWKEVSLNENLKVPEEVDIKSIKVRLLETEKDNLIYPIIIESTRLLRVWYKQNLDSPVPEIYLVLELVFNKANRRYDTCNMCAMFMKFFCRELERCPQLAGLYYAMEYTSYGMVLFRQGIENDIFPVLKFIFNTLRECEVDPETFEDMKMKRLKMWRYFEVRDPYVLAESYMDYLLIDRQWTYLDFQHATAHLQYKEFQTFVRKMMSQVYVECFLHGHMDSVMAKDLAQMIESKLKTIVEDDTTSPDVQRNREYDLPDGSNFLYEVHIRAHRNFGLAIYYQCPEQTMRSNVLLELVGQMLKTPFRSILRVQEQLGYYMYCQPVVRLDSEGLLLLIQTDKSPKFVDQRVEKFLADTENEFVNLNEKDFQRCKDAIESQIWAESRNLYMKTKLYWREIIGRQYKFDRADAQIAVLKKLTKRDLMDFYKVWFSPSSSCRRKLAVYVIPSDVDTTMMSQDDNSLDEGQCKKPEKIHSIKEFHKKLAFIPRNRHTLDPTLYLENIRFPHV